MFYNNAAEEDQDFFKQVDSCPEIKERLRRGVKLDELSKIRTFLETAQLDNYFKKQYGFLIDGINLIKDFHMDKVPPAPSSSYLTAVDHWVGVTGYYNVSLDQLARERMESKWIINTLALRTRMLVMNTDAYRLFKMLVALRPKVNRIYLLRVALIGLQMLHESGAPFSIFMTPQFVKYLWYRFGYIAESTTAEDATRAYELLAGEGVVVDEFDLVNNLIAEKYCIPLGSCFADDGWFHFMTIPTWTLGISPYDGLDFTGNYLTDWNYLVSTDC